MCVIHFAAFHRFPCSISGHRLPHVLLLIFFFLKEFCVSWFIYSWLFHRACWISVSAQGLNPCAAAVEAWSLNAGPQGSLTPLFSCKATSVQLDFLESCQRTTVLSSVTVLFCPMAFSKHFLSTFRLITFQGHYQVLSRAANS